MWVTAAAKAATEALLGKPFLLKQKLYLESQKKPLLVPITSASLLDGGNKALGITHCESGIGLDITNGLEVWAFVNWTAHSSPKDSSLELVPGNGVGKLIGTSELCLSEFSRGLLHQNLLPMVPSGRSLRIELVFPNGRELAKRTSNEAFGVVDGLALIGTQAEAQVSASPSQLKKTIDHLRVRCSNPSSKEALIFVIGENGLDLALNFGLPSQLICKTGNWLGPLLVAAGEIGIKQLLVFGYHGKLVKLAGGIFHTHHHLADGRLEVLMALAATEGLPLDLIQSIGMADSIESALLSLEAFDFAIAQKLWERIAFTVEQKSANYLSRYGSWPMKIGTVLFDRKRLVRWAGPIGQQQLDWFGLNLQTP